MKLPAMTFSRTEFAGSLGDLGTLLPITLGMIMVNGLATVGSLYAIGLFYLLAGLYFRVPIAVQPMKVVGAYAIATAMTPQEISSATLLLAILLFCMGVTGTMSHIGRLIPKHVVRGVQLSTGLLLMEQGIRFLFGTSALQKAAGMAEPYLGLQQFMGLPLGLLIGLCGLGLAMVLMENRNVPAAIAVIGFGLVTGFLLGQPEGLSELSIGLYFPDLLPFGIPSLDSLTVVLLVLVVPQLPMTIGNAVVASVDLARDYFAESAARVTYTAMTLSMALACFVCFLVGGLPLCHGAGGLAAHYRFGARTCGSNIMIGGLFLCLAVFFGPHAISLLHLLPFSILGVLLIFAGAQLGLAILDVRDRKQLFVVLVMAAITLASNLALAFFTGLILAILLRSQRLAV